MNGYSPLSQLLHSAVRGVRASSSTVRTIIHLANGWDTASVDSFYSNIFIPGELALADVDVMGFSFYPFYGTGATFTALETTLNGVVSKYDKVINFFGHRPNSGKQFIHPVLF